MKNMDNFFSLLIGFIVGFFIANAFGLLYAKISYGEAMKEFTRRLKRIAEEYDRKKNNG